MLPPAKYLKRSGKNVKDWRCIMNKRIGESYKAKQLWCSRACWRC